MIGIRNVIGMYNFENYELNMRLYGLQTFVIFYYLQHLLVCMQPGRIRHFFVGFFVSILAIGLSSGYKQLNFETSKESVESLGILGTGAIICFGFHRMLALNYDSLIK